MGTEHLITTAKRRSAKKKAVVFDVVEAMRNSGRPITVAGVAREAEVSRNYIYKDPQLRELVFGKREYSGNASVLSLEKKVNILVKENERLMAELESIKQGDGYLNSWKARYDDAIARLQEKETEIARLSKRLRDLDRQLQTAYDYSRI